MHLHPTPIGRALCAGGPVRLAVRVGDQVAIALEYEPARGAFGFDGLSRVEPPAADELVSAPIPPQSGKQLKVRVVSSPSGRVGPCGVHGARNVADAIGGGHPVLVVVDDVFVVVPGDDLFVTASLKVLQAVRRRRPVVAMVFWH